MYKLMIVDDEKWIRKGILSKLNYLGFRFSSVVEAENGEEAITAINEEHPDIVITDVKMPIMDGIEMIKVLRESGLKMKYIIISGYAEFHYAEQALNMGVSGYILKPVAEDALKESVNLVIKELNEKNEFKTVKEKNEILEQDNETLNTERILNRIFHSKEYLKDENEKNFIQLYGKDTKHKHKLVIIHIDNSNYSDSNFKYQDLDLMKFSIRNIIKERYSENDIVVVDNIKNITQIMVLFSHAEENELNKKCNIFIYDVYAKINKYMETSVTIAVSGVEDAITCELYRQAKAAFDMRLANGSNRIYHYENISGNEKIVLPEHKLRLLQRYIEMNDFQNINVVLSDIFSTVSLNGVSRGYIRFLYFEIVRIILRIKENSQNDMAESLNQEMVLGEMLDYFDNPQQIVGYLSTSIEEICKGNQEVNTNCKEVVNKAREFIKKNYIKDISVKEIAGRFAINPNYLSTIFKQETGVTLTKHLTDVRMEKACQLLRDTQSTINEIAQIVGYDDIQYFYRVFKKSIGQTPLEYRNSI